MKMNKVIMHQRCCQESIKKGKDWDMGNRRKVSKEDQEFINKNTFDHLGSLEDFISRTDSNSYEKYFNCINKFHRDKIIIIDISDTKTRYYCPECLISFDV